MSSLGVFHNEVISFDRETGKPKYFQAGSLYFKGAPSEDTRLDFCFPDNRHTEECVSAFAVFKKEALQRKKAVKTGTASPKEFTDWLYQQRNIIVELTEIYYS